MEEKYIQNAKILKALSDPKRLRIVDMLSCGELCACKILEKFHITQPTLSYESLNRRWLGKSKAGRQMDILFIE